MMRSLIINWSRSSFLYSLAIGPVAALIILILFALASCTSTKNISRNSDNSKTDTEVTASEKTKEVTRIDAQIKRTTTTEGDTSINIGGDKLTGEISIEGLLDKPATIENADQSIILVLDNGFLRATSITKHRLVPIKIKKTVIEEGTIKQTKISKSDSSGSSRVEEKKDINIVDKSVKRSPSYWWILIIICGTTVVYFGYKFFKPRI